MLLFFFSFYFWAESVFSLFLLLTSFGFLQRHFKEKCERHINECHACKYYFIVNATTRKIFSWLNRSKRKKESAEERERAKVKKKICFVVTMCRLLKTWHIRKLNAKQFSFWSFLHFYRRHVKHSRTWMNLQWEMNKAQASINELLNCRLKWQNLMLNCMENFCFFVIVKSQTI